MFVPAGVACGVALVAAPLTIASVRPADRSLMAERLREAAREGFTPAGFQKFISSFDPAILAIARRFDPAAKPAPTALARAALTFPELSPQAEDAAMTPEKALQINNTIPFSTAPVQAAAPFSVAVAGAGDQGRALDCLTQAIYYEAGFEPTEGQRAVAQVVLNRVRHPAFPKSVCGVVYQGAPNRGCQFTFACDGALARAPAPAAWRRARQVAIEALNGHVMTAVGEATHYHTRRVAPYWGPTLTKITQLGAHIFYRWPGAAGTPSAFYGRYAGVEPAPFSGLAAGAASELAATEAQSPYPPERRAPDDVGGRVVLGLGWTPSAPPPASNSLARILSTQGQAPAAAPAAGDAAATASARPPAKAG
ncbi:MAG TPA: cell wall hydrolase [Caulobacteraceae bacterium]|nr:cell wall hydrolase [Caulobacteraceae bacterium]